MSNLYELGLLNFNMNTVLIQVLFSFFLKKKVYDWFQMLPHEFVHSLTSVKFDQEREEAPEYYVVGTSFVFPNETEPSRGRILVFHVDKVDHALKLRLVHEKEVRGGVFTCAPFSGKLLVGVNSEVCYLFCNFFFQFFSINNNKIQY